MTIMENDIGWLLPSNPGFLSCNGTGFFSGPNIASDIYSVQGGYDPNNGRYSTAAQYPFNTPVLTFYGYNGPAFGGTSFTGLPGGGNPYYSLGMYMTFNLGPGDSITLPWSVSVPEPASVGLLAACGVGLLARRRRAA